MTKEQQHWEQAFVEKFVLKEKQNRYSTLLGNPRKRSKILDRLNHNRDFDFSLATELVGEDSFSGPLIARLKRMKLENRCWIISSEPEIDGKSYSLIEGATLASAADWGTVLICVPGPVAFYRSEMGTNGMYLFR